MAANFWASSQSKVLLDPDDLARSELHEDEAARGLTLSDLRLIKIHFCDHIRALAPHIKVRQRVVATALLYLRRVYVRKSMVEMDPRLVSLACIYLASKAEECPVQAKSVLKCVKAVQCGGPGVFGCGFGSSSYEMRDVLEMEMRLLHTLDYNLITYHPYRPLTVLVADAVKVLEIPDATREKMTTTAWALVNDAFKTDLCLLHPPHAIAAACVHLAAAMAQVDACKWLQEMRVDMAVTRGISLVLLEHYQALRAITGKRFEAALRKLPPAPGRTANG